MGAKENYEKYLADEKARIPDIQKLIDDYLKRDEKLRGVGIYYPSELVGCERRNYYLYTDPMKIDPETLRIFAVGNLMHDFVGKVLEKSNLNLHEEEVPFTIVDAENDIIIQGRLDHKVKMREGNESVILEIKSTKSVNYTDKPSPEHVAQLQCYLKATGAKKGMVVYIDKTNLQVKQFEIEYDKENFLNLLNRARRLHNYLMTNELPKAEAKENKETEWHCRYCGWKDKCDKQVSISNCP